MGNRWQGMFGLGEVTCIIVVTIMYLSGMNHSLFWRIGLALGTLPALILPIMRLDVPDTALSLIQSGRFKQAKKVVKDMFNDTLDMLPGEEYCIRRPRTRDFLADIWKDPVLKRASIFAWISNAMQGIEFSAFGFYLPVILILSGVSGPCSAFFSSCRKCTGTSSTRKRRWLPKRDEIKKKPPCQKSKLTTSL